MGRIGGLGVLVAALAGAAVVASGCGYDSSSDAHRNSTRPTVTSTSTTTPGASHTSTTVHGPPLRTTTTEGHNAFLTTLLADGKNATLKVVYDTPSGRVTLIRRNGDQVYADGNGVRFRIHGSSYECTGSGDGAACTPIEGDATQSDVDAYTGVVADALAAAPEIQPRATSFLGRTAECVSIVGPTTARAGTSVDACIDDQTGMLLRFATAGQPNPGVHLNAIAIGMPTDADFRIPVAPTPSSSP